MLLYWKRRLSRETRESIGKSSMWLLCDPRGMERKTANWYPRIQLWICVNSWDDSYELSVSGSATVLLFIRHIDLCLCLCCGALRLEITIYTYTFVDMSSEFLNAAAALLPPPARRNSAILLGQLLAYVCWFCFSFVLKTGLQQHLELWLQRLVWSSHEFRLLKTDSDKHFTCSTTTVMDGAWVQRVCTFFLHTPFRERISKSWRYVAHTEASSGRFFVVPSYSGALYLFTLPVGVALWLKNLCRIFEVLGSLLLFLLD